MKTDRNKLIEILYNTESDLVNSRVRYAEITNKKNLKQNSDLK
jgi:hypothetical protein